MQDYILKIDCSDEKGLMYRIADVIFKYQLNIIKNNEFVDKENEKFYNRSILRGEINEPQFIGTLQAVLPVDTNIVFMPRKKKDIVVFATKESHCLGDILLRNYSSELQANIQAIISNYDDLRELSEKFNIPYHFISHEGFSRVEHEKSVLEVLNGYKIDYIVLAKYMRILSSDFVSLFPNKIVNIHHSFLPAFIGANPYKQAYERGVKIIGATAHFVNNNLDEGPIISQDVVRVNHEYDWKKMQKAGRNVEKVVLANALDLVFNERIFVHANKTIIF